MRGLTITAKIYVLIALFAACSALTSWVLLQRVRATSESEAEFAVSRLKLQDEARLVQLNLKKQVQAWKDVLLRGAEPEFRDKYWAEFTSRESDVEKGAKALEKETQSSEIKSTLVSFRGSHAALGVRYRRAFNQYLSGCPWDYRAADLALNGKDRPITDALDEVVKSLDGETHALQKSRQGRATAQARLILFLAFGSLIAVAVLGIFLAQTVTRSVGGIVAQARHWHSGAADLTRRLRITSNDELGEIARAFNAQAESQQGLTREVKDYSRRIARESQQISSAVKRATEGVASQTDQIGHTAAAAQAMSSTLEEVTTTASQVNEAATNAAAKARHGDQVVGQVLDGMRDIAHSVGTTAERIEKLGRRSDEIGKIVGVIDEIADQTNLLALNAAIEAARAGEQGRGFAVVADEVRKLAERTTNATKEITSMIAAVQEETKNAVATMQSGREQVNRGVEITSEAGLALSEIIDMTEKVCGLTAQITSAATRQTSASDTLRQGVEQISSVAEHSATGARQAAIACDRMRQLADKLEEMLARVNVGDGEVSATADSEFAEASGIPQRQWIQAS